MNSGCSEIRFKPTGQRYERGMDDGQIVLTVPARSDVQSFGFHVPAAVTVSNSSMNRRAGGFDTLANQDFLDDIM